MNTVIAGDYRNGIIVTNFGQISIVQGFGKKRVEVFLDRFNIEAYEVLDEKSKTSTTSAVGRAAIGTALFGPIGIVASLGAKKKGIHQVAIQFKDGKRSLIELNDKAYKAFLQAQF